jgi:hypothetical protein
MRDAADAPDIAEDPAFVTREMIEELRPLLHGCVDATMSEAGYGAGTDGMIFSELEAMAAAELPGPSCHEEVARALAPVLAELGGGGHG